MEMLRLEGFTVDSKTCLAYINWLARARAISSRTFGDNYAVMMEVWSWSGWHQNGNTQRQQVQCEEKAKAGGVPSLRRSKIPHGRECSWGKSILRSGIGGYLGFLEDEKFAFCLTFYLGPVRAPANSSPGPHQRYLVR